MENLIGMSICWVLIKFLIRLESCPEAESIWHHFGTCSKNCHLLGTRLKNCHERVPSSRTLPN